MYHTWILVHIFIHIYLWFHAKQNTAEVSQFSLVYTLFNLIHCIYIYTYLYYVYTYVFCYIYLYINMLFWCICFEIYIYTHISTYYIYIYVCICRYYIYIYMYIDSTVPGGKIHFVHKSWGPWLGWMNGFLAFQEAG